MQAAVPLPWAIRRCRAGDHSLARGHKLLAVVPRTPALAPAFQGVKEGTFGEDFFVQEAAPAEG